MEHVHLGGKEKGEREIIIRCQSSAHNVETKNTKRRGFVCSLRWWSEGIVCVWITRKMFGVSSPIVIAQKK